MGIAGGLSGRGRSSGNRARKASLAGAFLAAALLVGVPALAQTGAVPAIRFSAAEEALFRDVLARDPAAPAGSADPPGIGAMVPLAIPLQAFPGRLMAEVPATRGLRYLRTEAGVVVVDPDTRRIVQVLTLGPRP